MSALLDRYARQATILGSRPKTRRVITDWVHPDYEEIMEAQAREWKIRDARLRNGGDPLMGLGFAGPTVPNAEPGSTSPAAVTTVTVETALYGAALYSPIPVGTYRVPQAYEFYASGVITSSGAGQTLIITPRIGTTTGGASFGASSALALGSTITNALWRCQGRMTTLTAGPGTAATMRGQFDFHFGLVAGAASAANVSDSIFAGTSAGFDSTVAQAFFLGVTPSATGVSIQATQIHFVAID